MAKTKVHLDSTVLEDLQALAARSEENLDHLLSRLLREALDRRRVAKARTETDFASRWITQDMKAKDDDFWPQAQQMRERSRNHQSIEGSRAG